VASKKVYMVVGENRVILATIFTCYHCANIWIKNNLGGNCRILWVKANVQFFGEFMNKFTNIVKIDNPNYAATTSALNEGELKV
jgi:hypothetical protein